MSRSLSIKGRIVEAQERLTAQGSGSGCTLPLQPCGPTTQHILQLWAPPDVGVLAMLKAQGWGTRLTPAARALHTLLLRYFGSIGRAHCCPAASQSLPQLQLWQIGEGSTPGTFLLIKAHLLSSGSFGAMHSNNKKEISAAQCDTDSP